MATQLPLAAETGAKESVVYDLYTCVTPAHRVRRKRALCEPERRKEKKFLKKEARKSGAVCIVVACPVKIRRNKPDCGNNKQRGIEEKSRKRGAFGSAIFR